MSTAFTPARNRHLPCSSTWAGGVVTHAEGVGRDGSSVGMPELPEVQTIASELNARLAGRVIDGTEVLWPRTVGYPSPDEFAAAATGTRVEGVGRRAKYLLIRLAGGGQIAIHLRMTGRLTIEPAQAPRAPSTRDLLAARVAARRGNVKAALLDQRLVAGLGNIYAAEMLFRARIHPRRTLASLSAAEIRALHEAIVSVLTQALRQGGTSFSDYRTTWGRLGGYQNELSVFRKAGSPCPVCGTPLERAVVAGRGTYYCPGCQTSGC